MFASVRLGKLAEMKTDMDKIHKNGRFFQEKTCRFLCEK